MCQRAFDTAIGITLFYNKKCVYLKLLDWNYMIVDTIRIGISKCISFQIV